MTDATAANNGHEELKTEDEALSVLLDGDIDKVMSGLDKIVEATLLREALHALAAPALVDGGLRLHRGRQAVGGPGHVHRRRPALLEFGFSEFFLGEERVTLELLPSLWRLRPTKQRSS